MADSTFINFSIPNLDALKKADRIIPFATYYGLEQIMRTLKVRVEGGTPVGIRYQPIKRKKGGAPVKGARGRGRWVASGVMKRSWKFEHTTADKIMAYTTIKYAPIVERGLYPGVGKPRSGNMSGGLGQVSPRTIRTQGGIFSSRAPGGILKPISLDTKFMNSSVELIRREILKGFRNSGGR